MPKLKTNRSAAKRMRVTKKGKIKRFKAGRSHLLAWKSSKEKRLLGRAAIVEKVDEKAMHKLLPYGK